ncbi:hypothetical protein POUND7_006440 [Theobroma cacao]
MRWGLRAQAYQREGNSEPEIEESTDSKVSLLTYLNGRYQLEDDNNSYCTAKIEEVVAEGSICGNPEPEIEETDTKVDRITSLPKEVMADILSRLTLEEAVRTSILSSKWRLSWTHFRGFLDFDASAKVNVMSPSILGGENDAERLDFRTWVNGILQSLRAPTIKASPLTKELKVLSWTYLEPDTYVEPDTPLEDSFEPDTSLETESYLEAETSLEPET